MSLVAGKQLRDRSITSAKVDGSVLSTDGTNTPPGVPYNALTQRVVNAADPINPQDLVTLAYLVSYVANYMDNSTALRDSSSGFVTSYSKPALRTLVDFNVEISDALVGDQGILYVQVFDSNGAPAGGTQALYCWPVNPLDRVDYSPVGREGFANGIFIGLSTTDLTYTASAETVMAVTLRYYT